MCVGWLVTVVVFILCCSDCLLRWRVIKAKKNLKGKYPKMGQRSQSEAKHIAEVVKNTMISRACLQLFTENTNLDLDLAELLFIHRDNTSKVTDLFCRECKEKKEQIARSEL